MWLLCACFAFITLHFRNNSNVPLFVVGFAEYICRLLVEDRGWKMWPSEEYFPPVENAKARQRPWGKKRVDFSNNSFYANRFQIRVKAAEHLYDRLMLAALTHGKYVSGKRPHPVCPPTYSIEKGASAAEVSALLTRLSGLDHGGGGRPWVWFLKRNLGNYGKGITTLLLPPPALGPEPEPEPGAKVETDKSSVSCPDGIQALLKHVSPAHDYVLQPHVHRPLLYRDAEWRHGNGRRETPAASAAGSGRKFHIRIYMLVVQNPVGGDRFAPTGCCVTYTTW